MDAVKTIFQTFIDGGYKYLCQIKDEKKIETDLIDFKTIKNNSAPLSQPDDTNTLSKALSGFANSSGGVIVWGIECKITDQNKMDCVKALHPVSNLKQLVADLYNKSPIVVDPGTIDIIHEPIEEKPGSDKGFVITYVPKTEGLPHQANDGRFYYRSGSSFLRMPQWMIADRFGRRPQPDLVSSLSVWQSNSGPLLIFGINNIGRGMAKSIAIAIELEGFAAEPLGPYFHYTRGLRIDSEKNKRWQFFDADSDFCLSPRLTVDALQLSLQQIKDEYQDIQINYEIYCDGFLGKNTVVMSHKEISKLPPRIL